MFAKPFHGPVTSLSLRGSVRVTLRATARAVARLAPPPLRTGRKGRSRGRDTPPGPSTARSDPEVPCPGAQLPVGARTVDAWWRSGSAGPARTELMCGEPSERHRGTAGSADARAAPWPGSRRRGAVSDRGTVVRILAVRQYATTGGSARACGPAAALGRSPRAPGARRGVVLVVRVKRTLTTRTTPRNETAQRAPAWTARPLPRSHPLHQVRVLPEPRGDGFRIHNRVRAVAAPAPPTRSEHGRGPGHCQWRTA